MSLDKVKAKVLEKAQARAAKLLQDAAATAERGLAEGKVADERAGSEALREAKVRVERETSRELERIQYDNRLAILSTKNKAIDEVFKRAREKIAAISDKDYVAMLGGWLSALPAGTGGMLRVNPRDESKLSSALATFNAGREGSGRFTGVIGDGKVVNGVVVDGPEYAIDCTIDRRLNELRETSAGELARVLFGA